MSQEVAAYYFIVENALRELGIDPVQCKGEIPGQWNLAFGDLIVGIDLWEVPEQDNKLVFQVQVPIVTIPDDRKEEFYRTLLEVNYIMYGVSFSVVDQSVYLKTMREANELKHSDVVNAIHFCGHYAEHYQKELFDRFGGKPL